MKALLLYVGFVATGAVLAGLIGYYVEIEVSATASLIVFLALFFANFAASWIAVIYIMDGSLQDAQGRKAQREIERRAKGA
jgi:divalent metal cation (Fe/Co/Zn/Cd) transporter